MSLFACPKTLTLNVVTTHLNAGDTIEDREARASQVEQLRQFIAEIDQNVGPILITNDFNIDSLADNGENNMLINALDVNEYFIPNISITNCDFFLSIYCK